MCWRSKHREKKQAHDNNESQNRVLNYLFTQLQDFFIREMFSSEGILGILQDNILCTGIDALY